jgi:hypothetical protein
LTKVSLFSLLLSALFIVGAAIAPANAQATRTWISGVGDNVNPCSRTAPCLTWAGAISKTAAGGEIDALDPGDFGAVTITKSMTLDGGGGQVALVLVSGTSGITISANQSSDVVILRNLRFNGLVNAGNASPIGINILSAARVSLENDDITGFSTGAAGSGGVVIAPSSGTMTVNIENTAAYNNHVGVLSKPTGGAVANVTIEHSYFDNNLGGGIRIDGTYGSGTSNVAITDSSMSLNNGNGINAISGPGTTNTHLLRDVMANNAQSGVEADAAGGGGGGATVTVGNSILSHNVVGAWNNPGNAATLLSFGNNQVTGPTGSTPATASFQ